MSQQVIRLTKKEKTNILSREEIKEGEQKDLLKSRIEFIEKKLKHTEPNSIMRGFWEKQLIQMEKEMEE